MKAFIIAAVAFMCACTHTTSKVNSTYNSEDYIPPTDFELVVNDPKQIQHNNSERVKNTEAELNKELQEINKEYELYFNCTNDCASLLIQFCAIDELVDSNGIVHKKPFCNNKSTTPSNNTFNQHP